MAVTKSQDGFLTCSCSFWFSETAKPYSLWKSQEKWTCSDINIVTEFRTTVLQWQFTWYTKLHVIWPGHILINCWDCKWVGITAARKFGKFIRQSCGYLTKKFSTALSNLETARQIWSFITALNNLETAGQIWSFIQLCDNHKNGHSNICVAVYIV